MRNIAASFYADVSLPSVREYSFVVWTNIEGIRRELTMIPSRCHLSEVRRDGEHLSMVVTLMAPMHFDEVRQMIQDCLTVELMLLDIDI